MSRVSVHAWLRRYLTEGVAGLADRSHRPRSCPHQADNEVTVLVAEMRRTHPRWGCQADPHGAAEKACRTGGLGDGNGNRILVRHDLVVPRKRMRPRDSYQRWELPGPMQLWQLDMVGGVRLVDKSPSGSDRGRRSDPFDECKGPLTCGNW